MKPQPPIEAVTLVLKFQGQRELLELLADSASDREAGRKAFLLTFLLSPELIGTQRELARRLGVSPARTCQMLNSFRRNFGTKTRRELTGV